MPWVHNTLTIIVAVLVVPASFVFLFLHQWMEKKHSGFSKVVWWFAWILYIPLGVWCWFLGPIFEGLIN